MCAIQISKCNCTDSDINGITVKFFLAKLNLPAKDIFYLNFLRELCSSASFINYQSFVKLVLYFSLLSITEIMTSKIIKIPKDIYEYFNNMLEEFPPQMQTNGYVNDGIKYFSSLYDPNKITKTHLNIFTKDLQKYELQINPAATTTLDSF